MAGLDASPPAPPSPASREILALFASLDVPPELALAIASLCRRLDALEALCRA
ncbi:MAG TPA: hypothetical protein VFI54_06250 [Solirubrobacteraceae bacterium]|nr:hypothetical protein [Solirubrobacteraceae bacterium]